jgi:hypothetical protein
MLTILSLRKSEWLTIPDQIIDLSLPSFVVSTLVGFRLRIGANLVHFLVERSIRYLSSEVSFTELPVKKGKGSEDRRIIAACVKVVFLVVRWSPVLLFKMGWLPGQST